MISNSNFINLFKKNIDDLMESGVVYGREKKDIYLLTEWTYIINIAIYKTIVQYNRIHRNNKLMVQPETSGRFPSDFTIFSPRGKKIMVIEHENNTQFERIKKNYIKLVKIKNCEYRLLVCYIDSKCKREELISQLKKIKSKNRYEKKVNVLVAYKCQKIMFESSKNFLYKTV